MELLLYKERKKEKCIFQTIKIRKKLLQKHILDTRSIEYRLFMEWGNTRQLMLPYEHAPYKIVLNYNLLAMI